MTQVELPRTARRGSLARPACWPLIVLALLSRTVPALEADELFQRVAPAVVLIAVSDGLGRPHGTASGVVVAPGEIVTNCHVIAGAARVAVMQAAGGRVARATLHCADPERDLCQLSFPNKDLFAGAVADIAPPEAIRIGARAYAIGAPRGLDLTISEGIVSSPRERAGTRVIQTTAAIRPGRAAAGCSIRRPGSSASPASCSGTRRT